MCPSKMRWKKMLGDHSDDTLIWGWGDPERDKGKLWQNLDFKDVKFPKTYILFVGSKQISYWDGMSECICIITPAS